jgi:uncharacterized protein (TIRG00374 family)
LRPLLLSLTLGVSVYAIVMIGADLNAVSDAAARLGVSGWLLILGLSLVNYFLRFLRWHGYLTYLGEHLAMGRHAAYYLAGFAFTTSPGKAGEAVRSLYLKRHGVGYSHSLSALFVERLLDVVTIVLLALSVAWVFESSRWPVLVAALLVLGALPLIRYRGLDLALGLLVEKLSFRRLATAVRHLRSLLQASSALLNAAPLYGGLALGILAWGAEGVGFYLILDYLNTGTSMSIAVGVYAVAILAGALSFIPGGLGGTEAVMVLLLGLAGVDTVTALAAALICRIATLWFAVAIGLGVMGVLEVIGASEAGNS